LTTDTASRAASDGPVRGSEFAELSRLVLGAGLLRRRPGYYSIKIALNLALLAAGWTAFALLGRSWWQLVVAVFLAVMTTQTAFLGHDAGHRQVARSRRANELVGRVLGNLLTGLSYSWWTSKHNRHHAHPNQLGRDPDIDSKALTFTAGQTLERGRIGTWFARYQAWLFFPMLALEGLNLHVASLKEAAVRRGGRAPATEAILLAVHHVGYVAGLLVVLGPVQGLAFLAVQQGLFGIYMGCSFAPNHKGMPVLEPGQKLDFLRGQVLTSRNIRGSWLTDFALGGLNYQIEHHLFPSMPRPALPHAQRIIREFCVSRGVPYAETSLLDSYSQVLRCLADAGRPAAADAPAL
jgi:fatty acid desaturase